MLSCRWGCKLSQKLFVGKDYVLKHVRLKHTEKVEAQRTKASLFNVLLMDPVSPLQDGQIVVAQAVRCKGMSQPVLADLRRAVLGELQEVPPGGAEDDAGGADKDAAGHADAAERPAHALGRLGARPPTGAPLTEHQS